MKKLWPAGAPAGSSRSKCPGGAGSLGRALEMEVYRGWLRPRFPAVADVVPAPVGTSADPMLPHDRVQIQDEVAPAVCFRNWMQLLGWDDVSLCMANRKGQS